MVVIHIDTSSQDQKFFGEFICNHCNERIFKTKNAVVAIRKKKCESLSDPPQVRDYHDKCYVEASSAIGEHICVPLQDYYRELGRNFQDISSDDDN